jgi:hypothetical protein
MLGHQMPRPQHTSRPIGHCWPRAGEDATADGTERDLRQSINDLNHRLRYALGEYDEPPQPLAVPE